MSNDGEKVGKHYHKPTEDAKTGMMGVYAAFYRKNKGAIFGDMHL